jgi:hypothetical protein
MSFGIPVRNGLAIGLLSSTTLSSNGGLFPAMALDFLQPFLDSRITFSRGSNATLVDSTGKITYAPANLLTWSQEFDSGNWAKTAATVTANTTTAPDGTSTADTLIPTTAASDHKIFQVSSPITSNNVLTVYAKPSGYNWILLQGFGFAWFDVANGVVGTQTNCTGSITAVGNGWYRCQIVMSSASVNIFIWATTGNGVTSFTGDGTSGVSIWGAQLEPVTYQTTAGPYNATTTAAYYGPRFDYDPVTLAPKGLLIEEQRTNLLTYSEQFDNAAWTKSGATVTANATTSPDGTVNADKLAETATTAPHYAIQTVTVATGAHTASVFVKAAERTWCILEMAGTPFGCGAWFNLSTGAVGTQFGSPSSVAIISAGNGWWRVTMTKTAASSGSASIVVYTATGDNISSYAGTAGSGIFVYGAQLEAGSFATSYIPTVASTVTRSADVATMTGTNFSSWYNPVEGTLIANVVPTNSIASNTRAATITDGTNRVVDIYIDTTVWRSFNGTTNVTPASSTAVLNSTVNFASAYKSGDYAAAMNGSAVGTAATAGVQSSNKLTIGANITSSAGFLNGHIRAIAYYNTRLPNAQLQTLTAPALTTTLTMSFTNQAYTVGV